MEETIKEAEVEQKTTSPTPEKNNTLSFSEAIKEMTNGKKVTKLEWADKQYYGILKNGFLMLHKNDDKLYQWIISEGDMQGKDYIILT